MLQRIATVMLTCAVCSDAVFSQNYTVIDLGTPGGFTNTSGSYSDPHGINSSGSVAGEWAPDANSQRAFLYTNNTNMDIRFVTGTQYITAHGLNASNLVAGEASSVAGDVRAFLYTNGTMVDLTTYAPGGFTYSIAHALNNPGTVVGESYTTSLPNSPVHAVIFTGNHLESDLGTLSNGTYSAAFGINNSNVIVGESTVTSGNVYAFIYSNGVMSSLGTLPGGNYSAAFAINDAGQIAGEANTGTGETHAFLFKSGTMTDLGTLGGTNSSATGINSAGQVVGYALTASQEQHAFLYNGSAMVDLNTLISGAVCTNLITADGINDVGQIAGSGYTTNGDYHAFLLTPVLNVANPQVIANHFFQLTVQGTPGQQFVLKASTNLLNWTSLATNTFAGYATNCVDSNAPSFSSRFYRAQLLP